MLLKQFFKFLLLVILIFLNSSIYAENNKLTSLDIKINNLNQMIKLEMESISKAVESNEGVEEINKKIQFLSVLISSNMNYIKTQMEIQKQIDSLSSPLSNQLNQLQINLNIETCNKYSFIRGTESFDRCLLNLILKDNSK